MTALSDCEVENRVDKAVGVASDLRGSIRQSAFGATHIIFGAQVHYGHSGRSARLYYGIRTEHYGARPCIRIKEVRRLILRNWVLLWPGTRTPVFAVEDRESILALPYAEKPRHEGRQSLRRTKHPGPSRKRASF